MCRVRGLVVPVVQIANCGNSLWWALLQNIDLAWTFWCIVHTMVRALHSMFKHCVTLSCQFPQLSYDFWCSIESIDYLGGADRTLLSNSRMPWQDWYIYDLIWAHCALIGEFTVVMCTTECWLDLWMKGNIFNISSCGQLTAFLGQCGEIVHPLPWIKLTTKSLVMEQLVCESVPVNWVPFSLLGLYISCILYGVLATISICLQLWHVR